MNRKLKKLIILDRDGVLVESPKYPERYILEANKVIIRESLNRVIAHLQKEVIFAVATNQQCVGKGLISREALEEIHAKINQSVLKKGGIEMKFYVCPHLEIENCTCRKPRPGLLKKAIHESKVNEVENIFFIGDQESDANAAKALGIKYFQSSSEKEVINTLKSITKI